jgi:omega-amidase
MELQLGLVQMAASGDKGADIRLASDNIRLAAQGGAELVVLPEMFCTPYETSLFPAYAEPHGGSAQKAMAQAAKENGIWLIAGSVCEADGQGRYYNTSYVYDDRGCEVCFHRKHHLFDIAIEGGQHFRESDTLSPGDGATVFASHWGFIGLGICFDVRFPDQAAQMIHQGARLLVYPASFNMSTGPLHWELLMRARALDGQCYVAACAPARQEDAAYVSWAHSLVVDPWAQVMTDLGIGAGVKVVRLDLDQVDAVRRQIPIL